MKQVFPKHQWPKHLSPFAETFEMPAEWTFPLFWFYFILNINFIIIYHYSSATLTASAKCCSSEQGFRICWEFLVTLSLQVQPGAKMLWINLAPSASAFFAALGEIWPLSFVSGGEWLGYYVDSFFYLYFLSPLCLYQRGEARWLNKTGVNVSKKRSLNICKVTPTFIDTYRHRSSAAVKEGDFNHWCSARWHAVTLKTVTLTVHAFHKNHEICFSKAPLLRI